MKAYRIGYYIVLGLFTALILFSVFNYFFNGPLVKESFVALGFPSYLVYPLAIAKVLGLIAIWTKQSLVLKEWAYAGFVFDILLAISAHLNAHDGQVGGAVMALIFILTAYFVEKKVFPQQTIGSAIHATRV